MTTYFLEYVLFCQLHIPDLNLRPHLRWYFIFLYHVELYSNSSRTDAASRMEIDFLISKSNISNRHNISPIEVKSGKNYTVKSLNKFKDKFTEQTHISYVLHASDFKDKNGITYLPLYMTMLL